MDELAFCDATTLAQKILNNEVRPSELLQYYIDRVERYNPEINAVFCRQLDQARGPLHGVSYLPAAISISRRDKK